MRNFHFVSCMQVFLVQYFLAESSETWNERIHAVSSFLYYSTVVECFENNTPLMWRSA